MSAIGIIGILILGGLIVIVFTLAVCKSAAIGDRQIRIALCKQIRKEKK